MLFECGNETCPLLDIKLIPLTQGRYAIVDIDKYPELAGYSWSLTTHKKPYAKRSITVDGVRKKITMHRQLLNPGKKNTDHINSRTLDNRMRNLRKCSQKENVRNSPKRSGVMSSKYKGVSFNKNTGKWRAYINADGQRTHLGLFEIEGDAAIAYNVACLQKHGEFAYWNVIPDSHRRRNNSRKEVI